MSWCKSQSWEEHNLRLATGIKCDNPQCGKDISNEEITYDMERDRVYCNDDCARIGIYFLSKKSVEEYSLENIISTKIGIIREARKI